MTNAFVVYDSKSNDGLIIDPAPDSYNKIIDFLEQSGVKIKFILLTHSHWDHIADCKALQDKLGLKVFVHNEDKLNLEVPGSDRLTQLVSVPAVDKDIEELFEGQEIEIGELKATVLHTPGHSPGGICLYFENDKALFTGDTLYKGGHGLIKVATVEKERMIKTLQRLGDLAKDTVVYSGHGPITTIGEEGWLKDFK